MEYMMVEKLGAVSLSHGVLRIQCQYAGADGESRTAGELLIPASQFGQILGGLQNAGQQLQEKMAEARQAQQEDEVGTE